MPVPLCEPLCIPAILSPHSLLLRACQGSHSILFRPDEPKSLLHFWGREYGRLRKFKTENKLFLQCYNSDQNKEIPYFYLRKHFTLESADSTARIYDSDASVSTNGDRLTAMLLALEKYRDYAAEKLENL